MSRAKVVRSICIAIISVCMLPALYGHAKVSQPAVLQRPSQSRSAVTGIPSCHGETSVSRAASSTDAGPSLPSPSIMTPGMMAFATAGSVRSHSMRSIGSADTNPQKSAGVCRTRMVMPVADASITNAFDRPAARWSSGHRGVDIASVPGTPLIAPDDGVVAFSGTVAGKSVVSIAHAGGLTSTFEPATSDMEVGEHVGRSQRFGFIAEGLSDHCLDICVHWGVMDASGDYLDPSLLTLPRSVALKPVDTSL